mmetsp:Transcript_13156/g.17863  ORF Transcript_13156/g.17863 Transcript_13156/m.17863 type:complete len:88 (-) Transcript_13156:574-837(-)
MIETGSNSKNGGTYFKQTFYDNMSRRDKPLVQQVRQGQDFTRVTFWPDLAKFSMSQLDTDIVALMKKRVYDLAGVTDSKVKVVLNGQ